MQPNNNVPNQPPVSPVPPQQPEVPQAPAQVPPAQAPQQPPQPQPAQWSEPSFYGTTAYQQAPPPPTAPLPPPPPSQGPIALTLPMWIHEHWKILTASAFGVIIVLLIAFQIIYPSNRLLPGTFVDGIDLGGMRKQDAVEKLNNAYGDMKLAIYFGSNQAAFRTPQFKDVGIGVNTEGYLKPFEYPWYLRVVPTSFFWAADLHDKPGELEYVYDKSKIDSYIKSQVGDDCTIPAKDASLKLVADKLQLIPSQPGGVCDITRFQQVLATTQPKAVGENKVNIDIREKAALVSDEKARLLGDALNDRASVPMPIAVGGGQETVAGRSVLSWLDFKSFIPELLPGEPHDEDKIRNGAKLTFTVNRDRMKTFMESGVAKKVTVKAGVNKVSTLDFTETSRVNGQVGSELDADRTAVTVENYLSKKADKATAETKPVQPSTAYTRNYNPTSRGFSALLSQWQQEHAGTWAMTMTEVSGTKPFRSASFRGDQQMLAAGTEAGYVGYAVLLAQKDSVILNSDKIAGDRNPNQCFTDMIEKTDQECIKGFLTKLGHETIVRRGQELGLRSTTFGVSDTKTTTDDLTILLNLAYGSKLAVTASGGKVLSLMQTTRMKDAIGAGLTRGNTANLAGELGTVHNDAAIVYSPKGVYLFAVLTDGASRADIAELTKKVEALHQVLPPKVDVK